MVTIKVKKLLRKQKKQLNSCFFLCYNYNGDNMKKGFTLIELLAVIVVMGVIALVTVPAYNSAIESQKRRTFIESDKAVIRGLTNYLNFNPSLYPSNDEIKIVSLKTLQDEKFIDKVVNHAGENCSGYVTIIKNHEGKYQYSPYYRCDGTLIEKPSDEGLVLDYNFDDFQEPTENFMINPKKIIASNFGTYGFGDTTANTQISLSNETYYDANVIKVTRTLEHNYMTAVTSSIKAPSITLAPGEKATFSVSAKGSKEVVGKIMHLHVYGTKASGGNFSVGVTNSSKPMKESWQRFEATVTNSDVTNWTITNVYLRLNAGTLPSGEYYLFTSPQLEKKEYSTPFTEGIRAGVVKDYSTNGLNANLSSTAPPKWVYDPNTSKGAYQFLNNTINIGTGNTFFPLNTFSISTWVKTPGLSSGMSLNGILSITYGLTLYIDSSGKVLFRMDNGTSIPALSYNSSLNDNQFHHIVALFDGVNRKIFIDGKLVLTSPFTGWTGVTRWPTNLAAIGQENNNGSVYRFNGIIDDLKIYNRPLSDDQVRDLYLIEYRK